MIKPSRQRPRQTLKELQDLQALTARVIMQPLAPGFKSSRNYTDGRANETVAAAFIKPNDRLTSFERIEIYNLQYWYRLIDCLYDDYPGLFAVMGQKKFNKLVLAYLKDNPSRSFTLRNLGDRLEKYIVEHPELCHPRPQLCQELAAFEWAQVVAFDGPANPPLVPSDFANITPAKLRVGMQPYITLLHLHWPLDDFTIAIKRSAMRGEASNAVDAPKESKSKKIRLPKSHEIFVAVHRLNNDLYYKRLDRHAYLLLTNLQTGKTLAGAISATIKAGGDSVEWTSNIQAWFQNWTELGWFCRR